MLACPLHGSGKDGAAAGAVGGIAAALHEFVAPHPERATHDNFRITLLLGTTNRQFRPGQ